MTIGRRGLVLAALQVLLLLAVGARYRADRARLPRVWARTVPFDPDTPLRGRYVSLALEVHVRGKPADGGVTLAVDGDRLVALPSVKDSWLRLRPPDNAGRVALRDPIAFFIPEHVPDPSRRPAGEELWAEVSVPPRGMPRPLRLGVRRGSGAIELLDLP
ncbi:MAG: GDYXXLXY domain-containing protein [Candidatus Binatia bacterium]